MKSLKEQVDSKKKCTAHRHWVIQSYRYRYNKSYGIWDLRIWLSTRRIRAAIPLNGMVAAQRAGLRVGAWLRGWLYRKDERVDANRPSETLCVARRNMPALDYEGNGIASCVHVCVTR